MARLPDRFDLWVRRARNCPDPARQVDYVLGALASQPQWHFLNLGTKEAPEAASTEIENLRYRLVFTDVGRLVELLEKRRADESPANDRPLPVITTPTTAAMAWCVQDRTGLLVNPGEDAALVPFEQLHAFHLEWTRRGGSQSAGFWIPNLTTEEEDFWQEHGY